MFISHDLRVVASLASHLIVMRHGKVVEEGAAVGVVQESEDRLHPRAVRRRLPARGRAGRRRQSAEPETRSSQPLDRGDLAAGGLDARDGVGGVFDHGRHVMRVGVNDGVGIARDRDMAFPENQVAALQFFRLRGIERRGRGRPAACRCRAGSRCRRRSTRSARGRSNRCRSCSCRPTDRACRRSVRRPRRNPSRSGRGRPRCCCGTYQPSRVTANAPSSRITVSIDAHHQRIDRRQFDRRAGKRKRPDRGDLVGRRGLRLCQRANREASRHSRRCSSWPQAQPSPLRS